MVMMMVITIAKYSGDGRRRAATMIKGDEWWVIC
jgi:hypothetical protein